MDTLTDSQKAQLETVVGLENKLVWAIYKGTPEAVEYFIEQGAVVDWTDQDNMSALYKSGRDGKHDALEILIKHGANMEHDGDRGSTALYVASQNGHTRCVEVLLKHGAYLEAKFTGFYTPIYIAAQKGYRNIVEMLINHGANLEAPCPNGSTALFVASQNGHAKVVELLLAHGANTEILFKAKTTPLEQAASRAHRDCVQKLLQYGAHFEVKKPVDKEEEVEKPKKFVYCRKVLDQKKGKAVKCILAHENILYTSYSGERIVTAYDTLSDQIVAKFEGHTDEVTCLAIYGDYLYSGSMDKAVMCWDRNTGELLETIKGHTEAITCILHHTYVEKDKQNFEVTKRVLYTGSADKTVRGWEGNTRKVKFEGHKGPVTCMLAKNFKIYTMSYDILYTGSADGTIRAYDILTGQSLLEFTGHEGAIFCMVEHDDILYTGSADNTIKVWDRLRGKCLHTFEGHNDSIRCLQILDLVLFSGSADKTIKAWGCKSRQLLGSYEGHGGPILCSAISKDTLFTGSVDETIRFWELRDKVHYIVGEKYYSTEQHAHEVLCVAMGVDGRVLYTGTKAEVKYWNIKTGELIKSLSYKSEGVTCVTIHEPSQRFFTSGTSQIITMWDLNDGSFLGKIPTLSPITCITVGPEDGELYTGLADSTARAWKIQDEKNKSFIAFNGHSSKINCVLVHKEYLFTGSDDMTIRCWKRSTGEPVNASQSGLTHCYYGSDVVLSMAIDGQLLFGGCKDVIVVWNIQTGKKEDYVFEGHSGPVLSLAVRGNALFSGSTDKTIRKWNKLTGEVLHVFRGNSGSILCLALDEQLLFSGSSDRTATCWTHKDDKLLWATHYGITNIVEECIELEHADVNTTDTLDRTLLMIACGEGHYRLAEYLISRKASVEYKNVRDQTALYFILKNAHWNLIRDLKNSMNLQSSSSHGKQQQPVVNPFRITPGTASENLLREKCVQRDKDFFRHLHDHNVEFDRGHIVGYAASLGLIDVIKFFMEEFKLDLNTLDREGKTLIQNATEHSRTDVVSFLNSMNAKIAVPETQRSILGTLFQEQNTEFQLLLENFSQMHKLFVTVQSSISTIVNNQEHIQRLLLKQEAMQNNGNSGDKPTMNGDSTANNNNDVRDLAIGNSENHIESKKSSLKDSVDQVVK